MTPKQRAWEDWKARNQDELTLRNLFISEPAVPAIEMLLDVVESAFKDGVAIGEMIERAKEKP